MYIAKDRTVRLPDDFPRGDAEIIVLYDSPPVEREQERKAALRRRALGADAGRFTVPDDFNDPLPPDLLRLFEGEDNGPLGNGK